MRPRSTPVLLVLLLLTTQGVQAGPSGTVTIHLEGDQGASTILQWRVYGAELTGLDLVRLLDGQLTVIPLNPEVRTYVDVNVTASMGAQYFVQGRFEGGAAVSNLYDGHCPPVASGGSNGGIDVQPQCIQDAPVVPPPLQASIKEAASDLLPM